MRNSRTALIDVRFWVKFYCSCSSTLIKRKGITIECSTKDFQWQIQFLLLQIDLWLPSNTTYLQINPKTLGRTSCSQHIITSQNISWGIMFRSLSSSLSESESCDSNQYNRSESKPTSKVYLTSELCLDCPITLTLESVKLHVDHLSFSDNDILDH